MVLDDETHFKRICTQLAACAGQQANETELKVCAGHAERDMSSGNHARGLKLRRTHAASQRSSVGGCGTRMRRSFMALSQ